MNTLSTEVMNLGRDDLNCRGGVKAIGTHNLSPQFSSTCGSHQSSYALHTPPTPWLLSIARQVHLSTRLVSKAYFNLLPTIAGLQNPNMDDKTCDTLGIR